MTEQQWGRVRIDADCPLRRGAWYRVTRLTSNEAVVVVNHTGVSVPRSSLQILSRPHQNWTDRKSTRLNSSHGYISYAVFCLKKKKKNNISKARNSFRIMSLDCVHAH